MEGITVLYEYMSGGPDLVSQILLIVFAVFLVAIAIYGIWQKFNLNKPIHWSAIAAPLIAAAVFVAVNFWMSSFEPTPTYKVTIDERVSYLEFIENYELVGREGEIFIIRDVEKGE